VSPESVRAACREVLANPSYREKARAVGDEMRSGLTPDDALALVREAASERRS
jgi:UDP:flavonoid glycosyltransferase YjiC (YdhE family)